MNIINKFGLINDDIYYCQDRRMIFCLEIGKEISKCKNFSIFCDQVIVPSDLGRNTFSRAENKTRNYISNQFHCHYKCIILAFWFTNMNLGILIRILL